MNKNKIRENEINSFLGFLSDVISGDKIYVEAFTEALAVTLSHLREYAEMKLDEYSDDISKYFTSFKDNDFFIFTPNIENGYKYASNYFYLIMQLVSKKALFETMFLGKDTLVKEINNLSDSTNLFDYFYVKMYELIEEQDDVELIKNDMIELSQILLKIYKNCGKLDELKGDYFLICDEVDKIIDEFCAGNRKI